MSISRRSLLKGLATVGAAAVVPRAAKAAEGVKRPPDDQLVGMLYDATLCIGCKACMVACREANHVSLPPDTTLWDEPNDLSAHAKNVIQLFRGAGADTRECFVKRQCMHCVDPACVSVCMFSALHKTTGGIVAYDADKCIGCRYCQIACPFNVPKFEWASATPKIVKCELCRDRLAQGQQPACTAVCPRQAVIYGRRADLLREARRRIAASPDKYVPTVYGEHEAGGTQVLYLSSVSFAALGLPTLGDQAVPYFTENLQHAVYQGFIAPLALYAALAIVMFKNRRGGENEVDQEEGTR